MKYLLIILILFAGCQVQPEDTEEIETEVITEPEIIVPVWTPEVLHIYIFNSADVIVNEFIASDASRYNTLLNAVKLDIEIHNRDYPLDPWYYIGGGT